jgi:hypothetical protein
VIWYRKQLEVGTELDDRVSHIFNNFCLGDSLVVAEAHLVFNPFLVNAFITQLYVGEEGGRGQGGRREGDIPLIGREEGGGGQGRREGGRREGGERRKKEGGRRKEERGGGTFTNITNFLLRNVIASRMRDDPILFRRTTYLLDNEGTVFPFSFVF